MTQKQVLEKTGKTCDECGNTEHNADHKFKTLRAMGEKVVLCNECDYEYSRLAEAIVSEHARTGHVDADGEKMFARGVANYNRQVWGDE